MQLRETEHLKQELTKSKESSSFSRLDDSDIPSIYKLVELNCIYIVFNIFLILFLI